MAMCLWNNTFMSKMLYFNIYCNVKKRLISRKKMDGKSDEHFTLFFILHVFSYM